jgi:cephalosporin-C deacetylase-like acetyl esterase
MFLPFSRRGFSNHWKIESEIFQGLKLIDHFNLAARNANPAVEARAPFDTTCYKSSLHAEKGAQKRL